MIILRSSNQTTIKQPIILLGRLFWTLEVSISILLTFPNIYTTFTLIFKFSTWKGVTEGTILKSFLHENGIKTNEKLYRWYGKLLEIDLSDVINILRAKTLWSPYFSQMKNNDILHQNVPSVTPVLVYVHNIKNKGY